MNKEQVYKILVELFWDSFKEDPAGIGDWFAQMGNDIDEFVEFLEKENK